eukprot:scaffold18731_cov188-Skeletonema_dohrnii-CCMP3373.AAC.5
MTCNVTLLFTVTFIQEAIRSIRPNQFSSLALSPSLTQAQFKKASLQRSVRYDMVLESRAGNGLRCLIRSPTTLQRRRYDQQMLEPCKKCFYTIMANHHGSLESVDRHIDSVRYDMVLESIAGSWRRAQMPHQVTYDVAATPIRPTNA